MVQKILQFGSPDHTRHVRSYHAPRGVGKEDRMDSGPVGEEFILILLLSYYTVYSYSLPVFFFILAHNIKECNDLLFSLFLLLSSNLFLCFCFLLFSSFWCLSSALLDFCLPPPSKDHFSLACLQCMTMECKSLVLALAYLGR